MIFLPLILIFIFLRKTTEKTGRLPCRRLCIKTNVCIFLQGAGPCSVPFSFLLSNIGLFYRLVRLGVVLVSGRMLCMGLCMTRMHVYMWYVAVIWDVIALFSR